ncbi:phosphatase PAP2 family protein [Actinacidiphila guanduensis]|uniref:phosphatase PAP2 family protein n=1 Tax=Actinacidiphila guanduensis TaxID=310781 RepID=UPI00115F9C2B|nr:phosphatase PAP2 family protein [Actinacidiphila guanduensis]
MHAWPLWSAALFTLAAFAFVGLAWAVDEGGGTVWPDREVLDWVTAHRGGGVDAAARFMTTTGTGPLPYAAAMLAGWTACPRPASARKEALAATAAVAVLVTGQGLRILATDALARPRPPVSAWATGAADYSFPSGHATTAALAAGLLGWAAVRSGAPRAAVATGLAVCGFWVLAVGAGRVVLGVHWPTDILGSWLLAAAWLALTLPALSTLTTHPTKQ